MEGEGDNDSVLSEDASWVQLDEQGEGCTVLFLGPGPWVVWYNTRLFLSGMGGLVTLYILFCCRTECW